MAQNQIYKCPYCRREIVNNSKDHIFPDFLGGTRRINSCKDCNDLFGYTFEAEVAKILQPMHVFISTWGIALKSTNPIWKNAFTDNGIAYDLYVGDTSVKPELSKPHIEKDENGDVVSAKFPTRKDAEKFGKNLIKKGKAQNIEIQYDPFPNVTIGMLGNTLVLGDEIKRLALKMCIGLYTLFSEYDASETSDASFYLEKECLDMPVENVVPAYDKYENLDMLRNALSHLIYVERTKTLVYGVVQFFGVVQLYCFLGPSYENFENSALLASLDPVNGEETFLHDISPLGLRQPPYRILLDEYPKCIQSWLNKFRDEAIIRGATHPPDLRIDSIDYGGLEFTS